LPGYRNQNLPPFLKAKGDYILTLQKLMMAEVMSVDGQTKFWLDRVSFGQTHGIESNSDGRIVNGGGQVAGREMLSIASMVNLHK
jgi:hypothetical protein